MHFRPLRRLYCVPSRLIILPVMIKIPASNGVGATMRAMNLEYGERLGSFADFVMDILQGVRRIPVSLKSPA